MNGRPQVRSPERIAFLRREYPHRAPADLLAEFNALPGPRPIASADGLSELARALGIRSQVKHGCAAASMQATAARRTPEREALLRQLLARGLSYVDAAPALSALPGPPLGRKMVAQWAKALGLERQKAERPARPPAAPRPRQQPPRPAFTYGTAAEPPPPAPVVVQDPALADAAALRRVEQARALLAKRADFTRVMQETRLPLREVIRLHAELRNARRAAA